MKPVDVGLSRSSLNEIPSLCISFRSLIFLQSAGAPIANQMTELISLATERSFGPSPLKGLHCPRRCPFRFRRARRSQFPSLKGLVFMNNKFLAPLPRPLFNIFWLKKQLQCAIITLLKF